MIRLSVPVKWFEPINLVEQGSESELFGQRDACCELRLACVDRHGACGLGRNT